MLYKFLRKPFLPVCNQCGKVLLKLSSSDSAVARSLPKLKAVTDKDCSREYVKEFKENFIENLFVNKIQENVLEYPEVDSIEDVSDIKKHFSLAKKLVTSINESKEVTLYTELKNPVFALKSYELVGFKQPRIKSGFGYLQSEYTFLQEALSLDPSLSKTVSENEFGIQLLNSFGNDLQKEQYLSRLITGELTACLAYVESGTVVSFEADSLNTNASFSSDTQSYVLSGTKVWVYNAQNADLFIVLGNVTSNDRGKESNSTLFLVDKNTPGIQIHEPVKTVGLKKLKVSDVTFNNVIVPKACVLGQVSEGVKIINEVLSQGKLSNGGHCIALMRLFINKAIQHCIQNEFFKKDKSENTYFRKKIAKMMSRLYVVESMTYLLTGRLDCHKNADVFLESLIIKIFASEALQIIVKQAVEILGTEFFTSDDNLAELSRDSQFYAACDDSNNHLRLILSTTGLKHAVEYRKKVRLSEMYDELFTMRSFLKLLPSYNFVMGKGILKGYLHPMFEKESLFLEDCIDNLTTCTKYLINTYGENVFERHKELLTLADILVNTYAVFATQARASRAYCIGVKFQDVDRLVVQCESRILALQVRAAKDFILKSQNEISDLTEIGSRAVDCKYSKLCPVLRNLTVRN